MDNKKKPAMTGKTPVAPVVPEKKPVTAPVAPQKKK